MENYSCNSYPESGDSSPRCREIDFENPPPWEDQTNYKAKFMCSYGGKIHPRAHDNQLSYIGGETKILSAERNIKFASMIAKLSALCGGGDTEVSFKYQLPGEDLDALISVSSDDDLEHMMHEYDRLYRASAKPVRMRLFIFPATSSASFGCERASSVPILGAEKMPAIPPNNVDFFYGLEKGMAPPPPVKICDPVVEPVAPPPPTIPEVVGSDHVLNPIEIQRQIQEFQRLQIRDQEQVSMYRKKTEDAASLPYTGEYYAQKLPEKTPPVTLPATLQQHVPATAGFWPDKQISAGGFPGAPQLSEHAVYMIPAPGPAPSTVYHAPVPAPGRAPSPAQPVPQMVRPVSGQASQGYYANVPRMPLDVYREQPVYNMVSQPPPTQHHQQPISTMAQQVVRQVSGGATDAAYAPMAAYDRQVYYTAPGGVMVPPQYQGVGVAVSGEMRASMEGKLVNKASHGST